MAPDLPSVDWTSAETARPVQRQRDLMMFGYVLELRSAYGECKADVVGLKEWAEALE